MAQADGFLVQRATAVAAPVEITYNQFTQFEDFPSFMRAIAAVEQVDTTQVDFEFQRWGIRRRWRAQIVDQRPEERIAWRSVGGMRLAGVTTFHSVGDRLTWIDASVVVEPTGALQRIAHRLRLVDLTIARELYRFKAYVEMREEETGAWRGYIADGEVVDEDDYFGWEPGEGDSEREAGSAEGTGAEDGSSDAGADVDLSAGRGPASNGVPPKSSGSTGAAEQSESGAGRSRGSKQTTGSRSRA